MVMWAYDVSFSFALSWLFRQFFRLGTALMPGTHPHTRSETVLPTPYAHLKYGVPTQRWWALSCMASRSVAQLKETLIDLSDRSVPGETGLRFLCARC